MNVRHLLLGIVIIMTSTSLFSTNSSEAGNMKSNKISDILNQEHNPDDWQVTNDSVMGGLSVGHGQVENKAFHFSGDISTENNGGFTSVFKRISKLPEDIKSINIRVFGDGNRYQLRVRSQVMGYELAYKIDFLTHVNTLESHTFTLADFKASFRGRIIDNAPLLKAASISHVGFLISAKQANSFSLSVHAIEFDR